MESTVKIDLAGLPGLETAQALYGAVGTESVGYDDSVVSVMVYIYDTVPPGSIAL